MIGTEHQPRNRRQFVLRRLHSLSGVFPIGAYLVAHIFLENTFILGGGARFDQLVRFIATLPAPLLLGVEILFIWGPLLFHSVYGFVRVGQAELTNSLRHDYLGAHLYTLQRLSGVVAFLFVGFHVWTTRVQYYLGRVEISYAFMHGQMRDPLVFGIYVVGVLAAVFHFTNGLWTFCITWGITVGQGSQRMARALALVLFAAMYGTAFAILMAFRV
jgi:succinate dehydrogenase / fumarate reductase cytochrome b subunit